MLQFQDLSIGDLFRCVDSGDLVFKKTDHSIQAKRYSLCRDNATCLSTRVNCYIPRYCAVIKLEDNDANETH